MEVFSFIFGAIIGSFLNVLIYRLPKNKSIIFPRSKCIFCDKTIPFYHNIPIFSYFILKAKCTFCKTKISFVYPLVEFLSATLSLLLYLKLGLSMEFIFISIFGYILITLCFIDFKYKAVPDYLLLFALIVSFFASNYNIQDSLKNAFLFSGAFVLLNFILTFYVQNIKARILKDDTLKKQEALGSGDIPIIATIGIILGLKSGLIAIFLASVFAIIPSIYSSFIKKDIQTPFIPYLSMGMFFEYFIQVENLLRVFN